MFHCAATINGAIYVGGNGSPPTAPTAGGNILHALSTAPPCTGVTAPTNGALGTCTSSLVAGASCQFTCNDGYVASGPTSCHFFTGALTAATCATNVWQSRNAVPKTSFYPLQSSVSYGTLLYTNTVPAIGASGDFHVYGSTTACGSRVSADASSARMRLNVCASASMCAHSENAVPPRFL
jgi:hypothetical protein